MLIIEIIWRFAAKVAFKTIRLCQKIFLTKDCRHCQKYNRYSGYHYCNCDKGYYEMEKCRLSLNLCNFERKEKPKDFFDILK